MILQMVFVLIMISSLSVNFDQYYHSFLIGYIGLRVLTAIQYLVVVKLEKGYEKSCLVFRNTFLDWDYHLIYVYLFESWIRYVVLYAGILFDIIVPFWGRKYLVKAPINTAHLLERFALLTLILFGESVVSTLAVLQPQKEIGIRSYFQSFHLFSLFPCGGNILIT